MAKKKNPAEKLAALSEDIEGLSFSDLNAWRRKQTELDRMVKSLKADMPQATALCNLAGGGLKLIADQSVAATLTGVEAILNALSLAEKMLDGRSVGGDQIQQAQLRLEALKSSSPAMAEPQMQPTPEEIDGSALVSLDDAAAFLIQLEPENAAGAAVLSTCLQDQINSGGVEVQCQQWLQEAIVHLGAIAAGSVGPVEARNLLAAVGGLLENAMDQISGAGQLDVQTAPATEASQAASIDKAGETADHMPANVDLELLDEFIAESSDLISAAEEALLLLEIDPGNIEAVGKVFRAFHTVKGIASFLGLSLIADLGHHAETLLSRVRDGEIRYGGGYADLSLRALDMIRDLVAGVRQAANGAALLKPKGYDDLKAVLVDPESAGVSADFDDLAPPRVGDILVAQGKTERAIIEDAIGSQPEAKLGVAMVKSRAVALTDVGQALRTQQRMISQTGVMESTVRIGTRRLDRLVNLAGELVIAFSMVAQDAVIAHKDDPDLFRKVNHAGKIVRELQNISMSMRMVPLKRTFNKMARLARDSARKLGKSVHFCVDGEDTEIDRSLVDIINDPLVHMVRNAVDHGIESPDERIAAGKDATGEVRLCAYHSAGRVVVEVEDDGKGLDRDSIAAKARERGLLSDAPGSPDQALSDREVYNMIFEPGFSTAIAVTDLSGRGVGMDVVKKNIESLRGQVEIRSQPGRGCVFKLSLPLTLAIIDGMVIRVAQERYVIPTVSIRRSVRPGPEDIATVFNRGEVLFLQGELIPLYRLSHLYRLNASGEDPSDATVVIVEEDGRQAGLVVDEILGRQQVVIKSLGPSLQDIPGIAGGAIMPDGRVGLILDIDSLIKFAGEVRCEKPVDDFGSAECNTCAA